MMAVALVESPVLVMMVRSPMSRSMVLLKISSVRMPPVVCATATP